MQRSLSLNNWTLFITRVFFTNVDVEDTDFVKGSFAYDS